MIDIAAKGDETMISRWRDWRARCDYRGDWLTDCWVAAPLSIRPSTSETCIIFGLDGRWKVQQKYLEGSWLRKQV